MNAAVGDLHLEIVRATTTPDHLSREATRILIVDDDESVRKLFASSLGERYECETAASFQEAIAWLQREQFALVLSDIIMPGRSGVELLREISARFPDTAVIMISGVDRMQRVLDAVRLGAYDYLVKPCDLDVLEMTVERSLERRALLRDAERYQLDLEQRNAELKQSRDELQQRKLELESLQAQLVHSEKMASLGQLAAGVAHELNNPAGFIFGNMQILKECAAGLERLLTFYDALALPADEATHAALIKDEICYESTLEDLRSIITDCHDGAERIRDVVQNLRTFSRLDEADFKKVDVHEGLDATVRLLSRYFASGQIKLERDYADLPHVDCYAGQLNQVWMNLLANAAQAVSNGGEMRIKTRQAGEDVSVEISDDGCGISSDALKKIFDPFYTTKPVGDGTGLGLSVTYSIVERHGGSINVQSQPGLGTTFTVVIPVNAKPSTEAGSELADESSLYVY